MDPPRRRRWPYLLLAVAAAGAGYLGAAWGAARATADAGAQAASLVSQGKFGAAIALDDQIAARRDVLFAFAGGDVTAADRNAEATLLVWAAALAHQGKVDQAAALLADVTDPALRGRALAERQTLLLQAGRSDAARGDFGSALLRLGQVLGLNPSQTLATEVDQLTVRYQLGEARALGAAGDGADAVTLLDQVASHGDAAAAGAALPAALLAEAGQEIAAEAYHEAVAALTRITQHFPSSPQAAQAAALLRAGQDVCGTLVDRAGRPITGRVRLSSHYFNVPGGYYTTGPFFYSSTNATGDFDFHDIPVGGPYVLEVFRGGDWTTFVDPDTNQPANPVAVTPLVPLDLTFIALP